MLKLKACRYSLIVLMTVPFLVLTDRELALGSLDVPSVTSSHHSSESESQAQVERLNQRQQLLTQNGKLNNIGSNHQRHNADGCDNHLFIEDNLLQRCKRDQNKLTPRQDKEVPSTLSGNKAAWSQADLFNCVPKLAEQQRKRVLVTGGAGFVGSHLVDSLMLDGHQVIVVDNLSTGRMANINHWLAHNNFKMFPINVATFGGLPADTKLDQIYHLASPASPAHYLLDPIDTIETITLGTMSMLQLAHKHTARLLLASTSEVYGDPQVHPQPETYWGNTNPIGPRSCYDESKRLAEALCVAHARTRNVSVGIARIFNTYGPRMHQNDGRVVSNFVTQAIRGAPMTVYGDGQQTRSFQYVSDLISGLRSLMDASGSGDGGAGGNSQSVPLAGPINLGNPQELTIYSFAQQVKQLLPEIASRYQKDTNSTPFGNKRSTSSQIVFQKLPVDDPQRRQPDISKAREQLKWRPVVSLVEGLNKTIAYFVHELSGGGHTIC